MVIIPLYLIVRLCISFSPFTFKIIDILSMNVLYFAVFYYICIHFYQQKQINSVNILMYIIYIFSHNRVCFFRYKILIKVLEKNNVSVSRIILDLSLYWRINISHNIFTNKFTDYYLLENMYKHRLNSVSLYYTYITNEKYSTLLYIINTNITYCWHTEKYQERKELVFKENISPESNSVLYRYFKRHYY